MSASKEENLTAAVPATPRVPKCARCRHHGIIVPQKGHMRHCPFVSCTCWKCYLVTQRTSIMALQRNLRRSTKGGKSCLDGRVDGVIPAGDGTLSASAQGDAAGATSQSATPGVMYPQPGRARGEPALIVGTQRFEGIYGESYSEPQGVMTPEMSKAVRARNHTDLQIRPAVGRGHVAGVDDREDRPYFAHTENWSRFPIGSPGISRDPPYFSELGQREVYSTEVVAVSAMGLPLNVFPRYPSSYTPSPTVLVNMPPMSTAAHYTFPPELGPPADCRGLFLSLPQSSVCLERCHEVMMLRQHPQPSFPWEREHGVDTSSLSRQGSDGNSPWQQ